MDVIALATKLLNFKTITPNDDGIVDFLINYLEPYGFITEKLIFADVTNLYAKFGNNKGPNFCFAGHTDVVPPGNGWSSDPFTATIKDKKLYGRGASDMKSAVSAFIIATIEFIEKYKFEGSISFLMTGDEEAKAENGTIKMLNYLALNQEKFSACIVGEPTCTSHLGDIIKYGRRGSLNFDLTVYGKQGHVAYPKLAINPIDILVEIIKELKETKLDNGNEDFDPSNLEVTNIFVGNEARNVIPSKAEAKFNIRFNNIHTSKSLTELIESIIRKKTINYDLTTEVGAEVFVNEKESELVTCLKNAIKDVLDIVPVLSTTGGTSDARFIKDYCPVIEFGLINKTAHHVDEHVSIEDIQNLKEIYFNFLKKFFKV